MLWFPVCLWLFAVMIQCSRYSWLYFRNHEFREAVGVGPDCVRRYSFRVVLAHEPFFTTRKREFLALAQLKRHEFEYVIPLLAQTGEEVLSQARLHWVLIAAVELWACTVDSKMAAVSRMMRNPEYFRSMMCAFYSIYLIQRIIYWISSVTAGFLLNF